MLRILVILLIGVAVVFALHLWIALAAFYETYRRFRGPRVVQCPATNETAVVELNAEQAAFTSLRGSPSLRIVSCSNWPDHEGCDQACLHGVEPEVARNHGLLTVVAPTDR